ncbi:MAG: phosphorylase, partial [Bacteroidetes bacterium]
MAENGKIKNSELILHPDGEIYHLKLKPENLANTIILVGDPGRVEVVSSFFDTIEYVGQNREICTHTGTLNNKRLTVMSTGMGTDNIDIVMNELDALVNIDLQERKPKEKHTSLDIIRLGTSGALQPDIPLNSFVMSDYGLGIDGLLNFYKVKDGVIDQKLTDAFIKQMNWPDSFAKPYAIHASEKLTQKMGDGFVHGITATAPGFYGPQGRVLRLGLSYPDINENLHKFNFENNRIVNFEMETSALYGLGKMLGHETLTVCVAIANR